MRISSSLIFQTGLKTINTQQSDLLHIYQQIGTGQNMVTPSDDPLGAAQAINLSQTQSINNRFADNRSVAMRNLGLEEDALNSLTLLMQDVNTRLVEAGNGTMSDADRSTLSTVIEKALDQALAIGNSTDGNGQYLFSGSRGDTPAFGVDGTYLGDSSQRNIQADQTRKLPVGDIGSDIFERAQPGTRAYTSIMQNQGTNSTLVMGKPGISDTTQGNSSAEFKFEVNFTSDTDYEITVTKADGSTETTSHVFESGQKTIDLGYGTKVSVDGNPALGDEFVIKPLAEKDDLNLFSVLTGIKDALLSSTQGSEQATAGLRNILNTSSQQLNTIYDNILTVRSSVGARMNEIEALNNTGTQRNLGYTKALSDIEDLDYYEASMRLSLRTMALEGASMAFKTIQGLSLFNRG